MMRMLLKTRRCGACAVLLALLILTGCGDEPAPPAASTVPNTPVADWDMYVTRHMGRALGRLQFRLPPGWKVTYRHDIEHPRMIVADRANLEAADVSYLVIGLTERNIFEQKKFDGPPAVWNAADYSPEADPVKRQLLDRRQVVDHRGHLGQGVVWRTSQTSPAIGDWEYVWQYGVDPGPGALNRDKQRINKFDRWLAANPGAPVEFFREYYTLGWGLHQKAWLQIYYKARNESIRQMFESMLPVIDEYRYSDSEMPLLGGVVPREQWDRLAAPPSPPATPLTPPAPAQP